MHGGHSMKRQRGRGRKPGGGGGGGGGQYHNSNNHQPNRTMESNGPETKVRGPASHIYERYLQLARDASSSGDRVLSENYLQHADHYFRLVRAMQPAGPTPQQLQQQQDRFAGDQDFENEDEGGNSDNESDGGAEVRAPEGEQAEGEFQQGQPPQQQQFDRDGGNRRRGRRTRYRPEGEEPRAEGGGEEREPQDARPPRAEGERDGGREGGRRERAPRERDAEPSGPEGFSNGPKPAFLRGGD